MIGWIMRVRAAKARAQRESEIVRELAFLDRISSRGHSITDHGWEHKKGLHEELAAIRADNQSRKESA